MSLNEILMFLIPHDSFQWIFLSILVALAGWNILGVKRHANPAYWEKSWHGHTASDKSDDLDADHGSLNDLSQAVASPAERLAEIIPGLLLVIGLLGTFLGLGIALNKASDILQHAQGGALDQGMGDLMGMMQGLGTKFKTSTWGILGFLLFKAWSTNNGFDERRLRWCVVKIKNQLDVDRVEQSKIEDGRASVVINSLNKLCSTIETEVSLNRSVLEQNQETLNKKLDQSTQTHLAMMTLIKHSEKHLLLTHALGKNIKSMQDSIEAEISLNRVVQEKTNEHLEMQILVTQGLGGNIQGMRDSIVDFIESNTSNIKSINQTSLQMAGAAEKMGSSAGDLKLTIAEFKEEINTVLSALEKNLGQSILTMSKNLEGATQGISIAVNSMSGQVKDTMGQISIETQKATKIQQAAFATFETTSQTLNESVAGMTSLIAQLKEDITSGLDAVSDKRQHMIKVIQDITKASENMIKTAEDITQFSELLKKPREHELDVVTQLKTLNLQVTRLLGANRDTENNLAQV
jgi:hypothetical protein